MTICTFKKPVRDKFWNAAAIGCTPALAPWLRDHGSLTQRIQQRCQHFTVQPVNSGLVNIAFDESALLDIAPHRLAYSREVLLCADDQPVVFAHSTCAPRHLRGAWAAVAHLGNKPLGALLFSHPLIERRPLHYKLLRANHALYQHASGMFNNAPAQLWARRSLFILHGAPLLVTEVFLPGILLLTKPA